MSEKHEVHNVSVSTSMEIMTANADNAKMDLDPPTQDQGIFASMQHNQRNAPTYVEQEPAVYSSGRNKTEATLVAYSRMCLGGKDEVRSVALDSYRFGQV